MNRRPIFARPVLWVAAGGIATAIVVACSSSNTSSGPPSNENCTGNEPVACTCANGQTGTGLCNQPATCSCNGSSSGGSSSGSSSGAASEDAGHVHEGDGGGPTPAQLYAACATTGSFGWPCSATTSGMDTTDCTDPNYPYCFVGGMGKWCTALCDGTHGDASTCFTAAADSGATGLDGGGCIPTACNLQGYCK